MISKMQGTFGAIVDGIDVAQPVVHCATPTRYSAADAERRFSTASARKPCPASSHSQEEPCDPRNFESTSPDGPAYRAS
jgi:hypothetical protein